MRTLQRIIGKAVIEPFAVEADKGKTAALVVRMACTTFARARLIKAAMELAAAADVGSYLVMAIQALAVLCPTLERSVAGVAIVLQVGVG